MGPRWSLSSGGAARRPDDGDDGESEWFVFLHARSSLARANVAVAEVRGLLRGLGVLVLERREAVLGKGRHPSVVGRPHFDLVEPGRIAREDQLLGGAVGITERREAVFL